MNILIAHSQDDGSLKRFAKRNKEILSLNAIVADKTYYSQAILEYQVIKKIIEKHSQLDTISLKDINDNKHKKNEYIQVSLLPFLTQKQSDSIGLRPCKYILPKKVKDLKSGFQFRHYLFRGENKTALQAFGIINNEFNKNDLYVVIDYIQYQDCSCSELPKIRYAVGVRSEFKISGMSLNKGKDPKINNLNIEKLAANVEFDKLKVDISMKTIGVTGKLARLNIPNNTSFNVQAYGEYVKTIDFIRNSIDNDSVTVQPEIIPVMDEYRTSISDINTSAFDEIFEIQNRYKKYLKKLEKDSNDPIIDSINKVLKTSLLKEVAEKNDKREQLTSIEKDLRSLSRYQSILRFISPREPITKTIIKPIPNDTNKTNSEVKFDYNSLKKDYNDAINLIPKNKKEARVSLMRIYNIKDNYGNAFEILNLLGNDELTTEKIVDIILRSYRWLLNPDTINNLKNSQTKRNSQWNIIP
ncbi:hypothetical protein [Flavobacterium sp. UBA7680]|uniref:hypothetical protein n=1 Tax=Flavobacterium sp. UBA7680 TaxID=1946559 RepID=UPI0025B81F77|nr:hypothetical protein [Flavobacterium sp. UBA7680]